jgi:hypothetical protein
MPFLPENGVWFDTVDKKSSDVAKSEFLTLV